MKSRLAVLIFLSVITVAVASSPQPTQAEAQCVCFDEDGTRNELDDPAQCQKLLETGSFLCSVLVLGAQPTSSATGATVGPVRLENPLASDDPRVIIGSIIKVALGLVGSVALLLFIYGGLMWMTAAGNADRLKRGRDTLVWAAIGLIVILGSYTVVNFVIQNLPRAGA